MRPIVKLILKELEDNVGVYRLVKRTTGINSLFPIEKEEVVIDGLIRELAISEINTGSPYLFRGGRVVIQTDPDIYIYIKLSAIESFLIRKRFLKLRKEQITDEECSKEEELVFKAGLRAWLACNSFKFNHMKKLLQESAEM